MDLGDGLGVGVTLQINRGFLLSFRSTAAFQGPLLPLSIVEESNL